MISFGADRRKLVLISPQLLHALLTQGNIIHAECVQGLPDDAQFVGIKYDPNGGGVYYLGFESEQWEVPPAGERIPILNVIYRSVEVPE
jgi:hypothetical protein